MQVTWPSWKMLCNFFLYPFVGNSGGQNLPSYCIMNSIYNSLLVTIISLASKHDSLAYRVEAISHFHIANILIQVMSAINVIIWN